MGHMCLEHLTKGCGSSSFACGSSNKGGVLSDLQFLGQNGNRYFENEGREGRIIKDIRS